MFFQHICILLNFFYQIADNSPLDIWLFSLNLQKNRLKMNKLGKLISIAVLMFVALMSKAQTTQTLFLSGNGDGNNPKWDFFCSAGQNSGRWRKIEVPSCWELQGFGDYTFGRYYLKKGAVPSDEYGIYRTFFQVPAQWNDRQVSIVFDGVMTDAEVKVNGMLAGPIHQGAFYSFSYDITSLLKYGKKNLLEVKVWKQSANKSVNEAERRADWWLFGGIFRPVWLKAVPRQHIERVEVDAQQDGLLRLRLHTQHLSQGTNMQISVGDSRQTVSLDTAACQIVETRWKDIRTWDPEHPHLYPLRLKLLSSDGKVVHEHQERIGFRTIEFREGDGIYLNGRKLVVKGINRHCIWPETGRTLTRQQSLEDARLIKEMNMNAVRSHYSPDRHFLDICDSLGILYLDEFCGWHGRYDTPTGEKLLREQMASDQNHPCIFVWANGNEGGWNTELDNRFAELDFQQRHVIHPWQDWNGVDAHHYPGYYTGTGRLMNGYKVFMPTEFLHAQYDRGAGAGLEDYWQQWTAAPNFAGGFIWSFSDEAVLRTDSLKLKKRIVLDSDGPNGPDGVVGPHREKEGSFFTIRDVWSPVQISPLRITSSFNGKLLVSNHFLFSRLNECKARFSIYADSMLVAEGKVQLPDIAPGERSTASFSLPEHFFEADVLKVEVFGADGACLNTWSWPIPSARQYYVRHQQPTSAETAVANGNTLSAKGIAVEFEQGVVKSVHKNGKLIPFTGGIPVGVKATFRSSYTRMEDGDALLVAKYDGGLDSIVWRMTPEGLLGMHAVMVNRKGDFYDRQIHFLGLTFDYPESQVKGIRWMGRGPYRVWKNRQRGQQFGIWQKDYNNTVTGEQYDHLVYPEFKGYHANLYWATLQSDTAPFMVYSETDGLYLRLFTPEEPVLRRDGKNTMPAFPPGDISFLFDIPAIQSFRSTSEQGPHSQPSSIRLNAGDEGLHLRLWFRF